MGNVGVAHVDHYYQGSYRCYYVTPCCGEDVAELQKQTLISLKHKISKPKKELNWDQGVGRVGFPCTTRELNHMTGKTPPTNLAERPFTAADSPIAHHCQPTLSGPG